MKVVKLNSHRITAMKMTPNSPKCQLIAACSRSMPSRPEILSAGTISMIMAVQVQRSVSMKTPIACISPTLAGWEVSAVAAAHGAEPLPASLEKSPRLTPFINTAPKPPAIAWRRPSASSKTRAKTPGSWRKFTIIKNRVRIM